MQLKHTKICAVRGEGAVTDQTCQKWFVKFCAGNFSLNDALWLGRSVGFDSDQIKALTKNSEYNTTWEIVDILKTSKSIKLLVKMKSVEIQDTRGISESCTKLLPRPNWNYKKTIEKSS